LCYNRINSFNLGTAAIFRLTKIGVSLALTVVFGHFTSVAKSVNDIGNIDDLLKLTPSPVAASGHGTGLTHIYTSRQSLAYYKEFAEKKTYPANTTFISTQEFKAGQKLLDSNSLYIMKKMKPGYDPKNRDWKYSVLEKDLVSKKYKVIRSGRLTSCITCHSKFKSRDFVASKIGQIFQ
jgi:hypothetical protein